MERTRYERDVIAAEIQACGSERIVVTHGTDSLIDAAAVLSR